MKDISLKEYFKLIDTTDYDFVLQHLKPKNSFLGGEIDFNILSYIDVVSCFHLMSSMRTKDDLERVFNIAYTVDGFEEAKLTDFFAAKNYLIKAFNDLDTKQKTLLKSIGHDADKWKQAGGEKLNKYSNLMPLVQLGEIYGVFPHDLQIKPYNEIFVLLVLHKEKGEVERDFNKLMQK